MHYEQGIGHIGGNLSVLPTLLTLYHDILQPQDHFILSKGHAAGALYIALWSCGLLSDEELKTFHADNTRLAGHPPSTGLPQMPFGTGSLGHGLPLAAGLALAAKLRSQTHRVFCLTSDGEWEEGANWEALIFIAHHQLPVTILIDANQLQGFGHTQNIASLYPLAEKFKPFGYSIEEMNGHNVFELQEVLSQHAPIMAPRIVLLHTQKGAPISFMTDRMEWHYLPMSDIQYQQALRELSETA
jgi:transketolase